MYNIGLKLDPVVRAVILQLLCVAVGSAVPAIFGYRDLWFIGALFGSLYGWNLIFKKRTQQLESKKGNDIT